MEGIIALDFPIRDIDGVLPVRLTDFRAEPIHDRVELTWATAWERSSRDFIVQRSSDLKEFGDIGRVNAAGETDGTKKYSFTDDKPLLGASYYRLRMVDQDGFYEYSKVQDVVVRPGDPLLLVSPNPVSDRVIRIQAYGVDVESLQLTSLLGQPISYRTQKAGPDLWELYPNSTLSAGLYFLHSNQLGSAFTTRVLVR